MKRMAKSSRRVTPITKTSLDRRINEFVSELQKPPSMEATHSQIHDEVAALPFMTTEDAPPTRKKVSRASSFSESAPSRRAISRGGSLSSIPVDSKLTKVNSFIGFAEPKPSLSRGNSTHFEAKGIPRGNEDAILRRSLSRGKSLSSCNDEAYSALESDSSMKPIGLKRQPSSRGDGDFSSGYSTSLFQLDAKHVILEGTFVAERRHRLNKIRGSSIYTIQHFTKPMFSWHFSTSQGPTVLTKSLVLGGKNARGLIEGFGKSYCTTCQNPLICRDDAMNEQVLLDLGITHVLNVAKQLPNYHEGKFIYCHLPLIDHNDCNLSEFLDTTMSFLSRAEATGGRCLVHCISGVSRSVALVVMYLVAEHHVELLRAYNFVKMARPYIAPNEGFKMQMVQLEVKILGYSSVVSKAAGPDWNFYALNSIKHSLPSKSPKHDSNSRGCCIT